MGALEARTCGHERRRYGSPVPSPRQLGSPACAGDTPRGDSDWEGVRLHVVTGKGGTGKTTVAAALALALAGDGRRTLLVEVEGRQGIAQLFDAPPLPYEERKVAVGPGGGDVYALAVDPEEALLEYLDMFYKLGRAGSRRCAGSAPSTSPPRSRPACATCCSPARSTRRSRRKVGHRRPVYDAVVLDAPPTGRITRFLDVNAEVAGLAKVGPIRGQADSIMRAAARRRRPPCTSSRCSRRCRSRRRPTPSPSSPRPGSRSAASSSTRCARRCSRWPS